MNVTRRSASDAELLRRLQIHLQRLAASNRQKSLQPQIFSAWRSICRPPISIDPLAAWYDFEVGRGIKVEAKKIQDGCEVRGPQRFYIGCNGDTPLVSPSYSIETFGSEGVDADSENVGADSDNAEAGSENAEANSENAEVNSKNAEADSESADADSENAVADSENVEVDSENVEAGSENAQAADRTDVVVDTVSQAAQIHADCTEDSAGDEDNERIPIVSPRRQENEASMYDWWANYWKRTRSCGVFF